MDDRVELARARVPSDALDADARALRTSYIRLALEVKALAGVFLSWMFFLVYMVGWGWVSLGPRGRAMADPPLLELFLPHIVALCVVAIRMILDLPRHRWPRAPGFRRPQAWGWTLLCLPMLPFVAVLTWRDRMARLGPTPNPGQIERAFNQLVRFPRTVGFSFLVWAGMATIVDAIVLGASYHWSRAAILSLVIVWLAALGPLAAILIGWTRAALRPEYLSAPRVQQEFRHTSDIRFRLVINGCVASLGMIVAPLAAGYLWDVRHPAPPPIDETIELAERLGRLARDGAEEALGAALAQHPAIVMQIGDRQFGPQGYTIPPGQGPIDLDGDERSDVIVLQTNAATIMAPVPPPPSGPLPPLAFGGVLAFLAATISMLLIARDTHRDVTRATAQADAVARGKAPPSAPEGSFSTREIRALVGSMDRLVQRITEANITKYVAIERAKEADRLKSQFLANMSHDLRSPLNSILGFSELLLSDIDGPLTDEQKSMVVPIHDNGRALLQQIDDILDTAKIEASRLDLHPEPTPAVTLVNRAIHSAKKRQEQEIEYVVDAAAGLPPAFVDPYRTVQAIENVLLFASERMDWGKLDIRIRQGRGRRGRMIVVQIQTPVRPATASQLARARRGFHRIPGHRGLGLGLPIAGSILELEGGALGIEDLGDGMVFSLQMCAPEARRLGDSAERVPPTARTESA